MKEWESWCGVSARGRRALLRLHLVENVGSEGLSQRESATSSPRRSRCRQLRRFDSFGESFCGELVDPVSVTHEIEQLLHDGGAGDGRMGADDDKFRLGAGQADVDAAAILQQISGLRVVKYGQIRATNRTRKMSSSPTHVLCRV